MKTRTDLLNHLAEKYNLQRYLEIGVQVPELNFDKIKCSDKIGIDPDPRARATWAMASDDFFEMYKPGHVAPVMDHKSLYINEDTNLFEILPPFAPPPFKQIVLGEPFDLIFIDGLHTAEQVKKDFENALKVLSPNGFIVLHDCNPLKEEHTIVPRPTEKGHWNGDVYKFAGQLQTYAGLKGYTVDIDNGCAVIQVTGKVVKQWDSNITWHDFDARRKYLLNLISWDDFVKLNPLT